MAVKSVWPTLYSILHSTVYTLIIINHCMVKFNRTKHCSCVFQWIYVVECQLNDIRVRQ